MLLLQISGLAESHLVQAFCWMLIHSLWQGLVFTIITGLVLQLTTRSAAVVRYNILSALLFAFIAVCLFTFLLALNDKGDHMKVMLQPAATNIGTSPFTYFLPSFIDDLSNYSAPIVLIWFGVFCIRASRLLAAFMYHKHVKNHAIALSAEWQKSSTVLCEGLQITRAVQLLESEIVKIPVVIGHFKPVIFIPVGLLTNLSVGEVEAILLHELAHIRRNDYLVNMLQVITETVFFFNPALLWMSNVLREERENCCDDIAIQHSKSQKQYLQALVHFKERALLTPPYAPAFLAGRNQLLRRVTRILSCHNHPLDAIGKKFFVGSCILLALLVVAVKNEYHVFPLTKGAVKENAETRMVLANKPVLFGNKSAVSRANNGDAHQQSIKLRTSVTAKFNPNRKEREQSRKAVLKDVVEQKVVDLPGTGNNEYESHTTAYITHKPETEKQQVAVTRLQAEKEKEQAYIDMEQANKDRRQAVQDRLQAQKDRIQAARDMQQAALDRERAQADQQQVEKDRQRADKERLYYQSDVSII